MKKLIREAFSTNQTEKKRREKNRKSKKIEKRKQELQEKKQKARLIKPLEKSLKWLSRQFRGTDFSLTVTGTNEYIDRALGETVFGSTDVDGDNTPYRSDFGIGATITYKGQGNHCMWLYLFPLKDGTMYLCSETNRPYDRRLRYGEVCEDNSDIQRVVEQSMQSWIQLIVETES